MRTVANERFMEKGRLEGNVGLCQNKTVLSLVSEEGGPGVVSQPLQPPPLELPPKINRKKLPPYLSEVGGEGVGKRVSGGLVACHARGEKNELSPSAALVGPRKI